MSWRQPHGVAWIAAPQGFSVQSLMALQVPNKTEVIEFLRREFPQNDCKIEDVGNASATVKRRIGVDELRPGGTVSGPVLMAVADTALYVAILGEMVGRTLAGRGGLVFRGHAGAGCPRGGHLFHSSGTERMSGERTRRLPVNDLFGCRQRRVGGEVRRRPQHPRLKYSPPSTPSPDGFDSSRSGGRRR